MKSYESFTEAYVDLCRQVRDEYEFDSAPRGMRIKEKLGVQFRIKNPRDRLPMVEARNFSASYFIAETLWYLSGSDSTAWISKYASFWKRISDDGVTANSAYGARIFRPHGRVASGGIVQWEYVKEELQKDSDSRRAVIHIRTPDDSLHAVKDVPCTLALQFFIREGNLHLHVNMRSSDIILGIAYDVPAFTMMQEILANEIGVGLGDYVHTSNSLHCYERDFEMLNDIANSTESSGLPMDPLPKVFPTSELMEVERAVDTMSNGEFLDGIIFRNQLFIDLIADHSTSVLVTDWTKIFCSFRARKMKETKLARHYLHSTDYKGFRFFNR